MTEPDLAYLQTRCRHERCPIVRATTAPWAAKHDPNLKICCHTGSICAAIYLWKQLREKLEPNHQTIAKVLLKCGQWDMAVLVMLTLLERCSYQYPIYVEYGPGIIGAMKQMIKQPCDTAIQLFHNYCDTDIQRSVTIDVSWTAPTPTLSIWMFDDYTSRAPYWRRDSFYASYPFEWMIDELVAITLTIDRAQTPEHIATLMSASLEIDQSMPASRTDRMCIDQAAVTLCARALRDRPIITSLMLCCWASRPDLLASLDLEGNMEYLSGLVDFHKCLEYLCKTNSTVILGLVLKQMTSVCYHSHSLLRIACRAKALTAAVMLIDKWRWVIASHGIDRIMLYACEHSDVQVIKMLDANFGSDTPWGIYREAYDTCTRSRCIEGASILTERHPSILRAAGGS